MLNINSSNDNNGDNYKNYNSNLNSNVSIDDVVSIMVIFYCHHSNMLNFRSLEYRTTDSYVRLTDISRLK